MGTKYTEKNLAAIAELQQRLADLELSEEWMERGFLIRWLEAREFNVKKAEEMLRESLKWRKENDVDSILEWKRPADLYSICTIEQCGFDNEGCPVFISDLRNFDLNVFLKYPSEIHEKLHIQNCERVSLAIRAQNKIHESKEIHRDVVIMDLEGFNMWSFITTSRYFDTFRKNTNLCLLHYPESTKVMYIVNAPKLYSIAFTMMKPFLPAATISKIKVFGCNKDSWIPELLNVIPKDQLPTRYGGTNKSYEMQLLKILEGHGTSSTVLTSKPNRSNSTSSEKSQDSKKSH